MRDPTTCAEGGAPGGGGGAGEASFALPGAEGVISGLDTAGQNGSVTVTAIARAPLPIRLSATPDHLAWQQPLPVTLTLANVLQAPERAGDQGFPLCTYLNALWKKGICLSAQRNAAASLPKVDWASNVPKRVGEHSSLRDPVTPQRCWSRPA